MANLISPEYKALLQEKHAKKPWGGAGKSWVPHIAPLLNRFPSPVTILDYGCGRGTFKPEMLKLLPDAIITEYDPGVAGKDVLDMTPVDYVVCTDVLEHVEEGYVPATLDMLHHLAKGGIFLNIDTAESRSFLPDGRNTHITIKSHYWWNDMLRNHIPFMWWETIELTRSRWVVHGVRCWNGADDVE